MTIKTFEMRLKWSEMMTPKVKHFAFEHANGEIISFTPGQFISVHFTKDDQELKRSYSIASIPNDNHLIEFAAGYTKHGPGTEFLFDLQPGDCVRTSGPFGRLVLRPDETPKRYVMVATSTGVTPFRTMLPNFEHLLNERDMDIEILLGVRSREHLIYTDEFLNISQKQPRFRFSAFFSQGHDTDLAEYEHRGYVQTAFDALELNPDQDIVYLCGNPNMIDDAFNKLKELGFGPHGVRREKYISPHSPLK